MPQTRRSVGRSCRIARPRHTTCSITSPTWTSRGDLHLRHVALPGHRNHVLRRHVCRLPDLSPRRTTTPGSPAARHGDRLGAINTAVLICCSLTMVLAVHSRKVGKPQVDCVLPGADLAVRLRLPGHQGRRISRTLGAPRSAGTEFHFEHDGNYDPQQAQIFFSLYFAMTGMHALHMIIGIGLVTWLLMPTRADASAPEYNTPVENGRAVLALCRYCLDLSVSAALPDQPSPQRVGEENMTEHAHPTVKTFVAVWVALLVLTAVTVFVATLDLGPFNAIVALTIATVKALLVLLVFHGAALLTALPRLPWLPPSSSCCLLAG